MTDLPGDDTHLRIVPLPAAADPLTMNFVFGCGDGYVTLYAFDGEQWVSISYRRERTTPDHEREYQEVIEAFRRRHITSRLPRRPA